MLQPWQKTVKKNIRNWTSDQCREWLERRAAENNGKPTAILHDTVRELTGGYCTQTIDFWTARTVYDKMKKKI